MATIITREVGTTAKGSPLTNTEIDNNFINLNREVSYAGPSIAPSLNLDFVNSKTVDPRITFTRASTATHYDGKTVAKAEENLHLNSQTFSTWTGFAMAVTDNAAAAPDGTNTAAFLVPSAASSRHYIYSYNNTGLTSAGVTVTASVYAKAGTYKYCYVHLNNNTSGGGLRVTRSIDLTNGTVGGFTANNNATNQSVVVSPAGNGWYRIAITTTSTTTGGGGDWNIAIGPMPTSGATYVDGGDYIPTYTPDGTSGAYFWGAQIEQREYATAYVPTTSNPITNYIPALQTAPANVSRLDYDPVTGEAKGLLVEEQRTNSISASEDFQFWINSKRTLLSNVAISPSGTLTADKFVRPDGAADSQDIYRNVTGLIGVGTKHTFTVYAKYGGIQYLYMTPGGRYSYQTSTTHFDLLNGTKIESSATSSIAPVGNGWYRCSITFTDSGGGDAYFYLQARNGNGTLPIGNGYDGIFLWGGQFEVGAFATSYIPTALTYSGRASVATYLGDDGYLKTAQAGEARYERNAAGGKQLLLEGAGSNLLVNTSSLSTAPWGATGTVEVTPNVEVAPDGTFTADKVYFRSGAVNDRLDQVVGTIFPTVGSTYSYTIWLKGSGVVRIGVNTTDGAGGSGETVCTLTNTWKRYFVTHTFLSGVTGALRVHGLIIRSASNPTVYAWGAQLESGSDLTSYIPSTETFTSRASTATYLDSTGLLRTAPSNAARYGYGYDSTRATWVSAGLLAEAQATNLHPYSATSSMILEQSGGSYVLDTGIVAPDGNTGSVVKLTSSEIDQEHFWQFNYNLPANTPVGTQTTYSVFVKAGTQQLVSFRTVFSNGINDVSSVFDLSNGSVVSISATHSNVRATALPNGWYRISLTFTVPSLVSAPGHIRINFPTTSSVNKYMYVWGTQAESGPVLTSYIPTNGSQVTRAADAISSIAGSRAADVYSAAQATRSGDDGKIAGTAFSTIFNVAENTTFAESTLIGIGQYAAYPVILSGGMHISTVGYTSSTNLRGLKSNSVGTTDFDKNINTSTATNKTAIALKANDSVFSANGSISGVDTDVSVPYGEKLEFMQPLSNLVTGAAYLRKIAIYPKRLSNTELQALTAG